MMHINYTRKAEKFFALLSRDEKEKACKMIERLKEQDGIIRNHNTTEMFPRCKGLVCLRVICSSSWLRIFFTIKDHEIYILHGFFKKTNTTPVKEIETAYKLMKNI